MHRDSIDRIGFLLIRLPLLPRLRLFLLETVKTARHGGPVSFGKLFLRDLFTAEEDSLIVF